jgi:hypothetical protein
VVLIGSTVMSTNQELLAEHKSQLSKIEAQLIPLSAKADALRQIITGYEKLVAAEEGARPEPAAPEAPAMNGGSAPTVAEESYGSHSRRAKNASGRGLKHVLRDLLEEHGHLSVHETFRLMELSGDWPRGLPTRNTLVSRFGDLVREGYALSDGRGGYSLTASAASDVVRQQEAF